MMKTNMKPIKYILPFFFLGLMASCGGGEDASEENPNGIKISGEITGANNQKVILYMFEEGGNSIVDSTTVKDNSFELWTETKEFREYILEFGESNQSVSKPVNNYIYLIPDENSAAIEIKGSFPGVGDNYTLTGDQNSIDFKAYQEFVRPYHDQIQTILKAYSNEVDTNIALVQLAQMDSLKAYCTNYAIDYINEKPGSPASWVMLKEFYPPVGLADFDTTHFEYFEKVRDAMSEKYPYSYASSIIDQDMASVKSQLAELTNNPGGDLAPEIIMDDPDGNPIALSSLRGKVVLIDFWASWCAPCRKENPNVVKTYNEYKDKGFTVYSVSLDQKKDAWVKAIENDNLVWPNHVSDLKGWENEAAQAYGVNSIPATFLLDRNGNIIDSNLRGGRLEQRLQEILG